MGLNLTLTDEELPALIANLGEAAATLDEKRQELKNAAGTALQNEQGLPEKLYADLSEKLKDSLGGSSLVDSGSEVHRELAFIN